MSKALLEEDGTITWKTATGENRKGPGYQLKFADGRKEQIIQRRDAGEGERPHYIVTADTENPMILHKDFLLCDDIFNVN